MSYDLQIGPDKSFPLASNRGYGDVLDWLETLPLKGNENLKHLGKFGWDDNPKAVHQQLDAALKAAPPRRPDVRKTLEGVLKNLANPGAAKVVSVTNGVGEAGNDAYQEEHGDDEGDGADGDRKSGDDEDDPGEPRQADRRQ